MSLHIINFTSLNRHKPNIAANKATTTTKSRRKMFITRRIHSVGGGGGGGVVSSVCSCIVQLLVALQMLMTLEMPLSTTMALPVTSKPIESTAENLAWQAWIMLPPEQKQLMKSRKVTPKSIFTLPLRVECPEGHQQVDTKCIPTVIGSNAVLIDPSVLGLVLGSVSTDIEYDYEDEGGDDHQANANTMHQSPSLYMSGSTDDTALELKPPSRDEPLKFNIFQSKFPTDDYAMEDYSAVSNEGAQTQDMETNVNESIGINETISIRLNITANITTAERDLVSEASNVSKVHSFTTLPDSSDFNLDDIDAISLPASGNLEENSRKISLFKEDSSLHLVTSDMETESSGVGEKEYVTHAKADNDLETLLQTESLMPLINQTATLPPESLTRTTAIKEDTTKTGVNDESSTAFSLNIDSEEMTTTLPHKMEKELVTMESQDKAEFIRSVTMDSLNSNKDEGDDGIEITTLTPSTSNDEPLEFKFEEEDETATIPIIQLDDTTIIEGNGETSSSMSISSTTPAAVTETLSSTSSSSSPSSLSTTPLSSSSSLLSSVEPSLSAVTPTLQPLAEAELTTLLWQQEQALKDFEELQRMRKGQKDQHTVMKKSKVEPVEVLAVAAAAKTTTTTTTNLSKTMPSETTTATTRSMDELITTTETETATATVTPLLSVHNNDRFYYQHVAKQDRQRVEVSAEPQQQQHQQQSSSTKSTSWPTDIKTLAQTAATETTSEINLAQELRLINDLVKGKRPSTIAAAKFITSTTSKTATTTTPAPITTTVKTSSIIGDGIISTSTSSIPPTPVSSSSESSVNFIKPTRATTDIWSKIMPFMQTTTNPTKSSTTVQQSSTTSTTTNETSTTTSDKISTTSFNPSTPPSAVVGNRSHRNSKIIRINGFNAIHDDTPPTFITSPTRTTTTTTTTATNDISSTPTSATLSTLLDDDSSTSSPSSSSTGGSPEHFWWLPVAWRLDKPSTTTTTENPIQAEDSSEDMPLLLRFWSAYHAPKSS